MAGGVASISKDRQQLRLVMITAAAASPPAPLAGCTAFPRAGPSPPVAGSEDAKCPRGRSRIANAAAGCGLYHPAELMLLAMAGVAISVTGVLAPRTERPRPAPRPCSARSNRCRATERRRTGPSPRY